MSVVRLLRRPDEAQAAFGSFHGTEAAGPALPDAPGEPSELEKAEALYRQRSLRDSMFAHGAIFQDPAWDLVLELFIAHVKGQILSVTGACEGAGLPSTTGLRWLKVLEQRQMVVCSRDFNDRRRRLVRLLPETVSAMRTLLRAL